MKEDLIKNAPIRSLQQMLWTISFLDPSVPPVIPDGIFGDTTKKAVLAFQKLYSLPVTGIADQNTFYKVVEIYDRDLVYLTGSEAPIARFPAEPVLESGQSNPYITVVQGMLIPLSHLSGQFSTPQANGILDQPTTEALRIIQLLYGMEPTGKLDAKTYDRVARLYAGSFDRGTCPSCG